MVNKLFGMYPKKQLIFNIQQDRSGENEYEKVRVQDML